MTVWPAARIWSPRVFSSSFSSVGTHDSKEYNHAIDRLADMHGLSASGLAIRAGLDATSFNRSKRFSPDGKSRWPSFESIAKILGATSTSLGESQDCLRGSCLAHFICTGIWEKKKMVAKLLAQKPVNLAALAESLQVVARSVLESMYHTYVNTPEARLALPRSRAEAIRRIHLARQEIAAMEAFIAERDAERRSTKQR
jgi:hypothetical protein